VIDGFRSSARSAVVSVSSISLNVQDGMRLCLKPTHLPMNRCLSVYLAYIWLRGWKIWHLPLTSSTRRPWTTETGNSQNEMAGLILDSLKRSNIKKPLIRTSLYLNERLIKCQQGRNCAVRRFAVGHNGRERG
jgi:hypothetical protein